MRDIPLLLLTLACAVTALRNPVYGIFAYIGYSLAAPHALTFGMAQTFPHVAAIAACTIVGYLFGKERKSLPNERELLLLLAVWAWFGFSTLFAIEPQLAAEKLAYVSKILFMVVLTMSLIRTEDHIRLLLKIIALSLGFHALKIGLFVLRTGAQSTVFGPDASFLEANNSMGMALAMNVPLLFYLSRVESNIWLRSLMLAMLVLSYPAIAGTFSRGAWLAVGVATGLMILRSKRKGSAVLIGVLVAVLAPVWLPIFLEKFVSEKLVERYDLLRNYEEDDSAQSRFWNWTFCAKVGFAHPIEGGGFDYYSVDAYAKYYPEFLIKYPGKVWSCHNMWLTILGEHGIIAFVLWVGLLGSCFLSIRRMRRIAKARDDLPTLIVYCDMIEISLIAYMIAGTFLDIAYFEVYYTLVAAIILLKDWMLKQVATTSTPQSSMGSINKMTKAPTLSPI